MSYLYKSPRTLRLAKESRVREKARRASSGALDDGVLVERPAGRLAEPGEGDRPDRGARVAERGECRLGQGPQTDIGVSRSGWVGQSP